MKIARSTTSSRPSSSSSFRVKKNSFATPQKSTIGEGDKMTPYKAANRYITFFEKISKRINFIDHKQLDKLDILIKKLIKE